MAKLIAHASFFKRVFSETIFKKCFEKVDNKKKLEVYIVPPHKAKTLKQNNTFWGLVTAIYQAGLSSHDSVESFRHHFMERAGLITYKVRELEPEASLAIVKLSREFNHCSRIQDSILSTLVVKEIDEYRSLSIASSKTLALMIDDVIEYYKKTGTSVNKVEEILINIDY